MAASPGLREDGVGPEQIEDEERAIIARFIEIGGNLDAPDDEGQPLLHLAAELGLVGSVQLLLHSGADPAIKCSFGNTPLHEAAINGHGNVAKLLIDSRVDIDPLNNLGFSPLFMAVSSGQTSVVRLLANNGADVKLPENSGHPPLHAAAALGYVDVARLLADFGANITDVDRQGFSPLRVAIVSRRQRAMLGDDSVFLDETEPRIRDALANGNLDMVRFLISRGANLDVVDQSGWTPIYYGVRDGSLEVVKELADCGADISTVRNGDGLLHIAVMTGRQEKMTRLLIDLGVNWATKDSQGRTPLHLAAASGNLEVVRLLADCMGDLAALDGQVDSLIQAARSSGKVEVLGFLYARITDLAINGSVSQPMLSELAHHSGTPFPPTLVSTRGGRASFSLSSDPNGRSLYEAATWSDGSVILNNASSKKGVALAAGRVIGGTMNSVFQIAPVAGKKLGGWQGKQLHALRANVTASGKPKFQFEVFNTRGQRYDYQWEERITQPTNIEEGQNFMLSRARIPTEVQDGSSSNVERRDHIAELSVRSESSRMPSFALHFHWTLSVQSSTAVVIAALLIHRLHLEGQATGKYLREQFGL